MDRGTITVFPAIVSRQSVSTVLLRLIRKPALLLLLLAFCFPVATVFLFLEIFSNRVDVYQEFPSPRGDYVAVVSSRHSAISIGNDSTTVKVFELDPKTRKKRGGRLVAHAEEMPFIHVNWKDDKSLNLTCVSSDMTERGFRLVSGKPAELTVTGQFLLPKIVEEVSRERSPRNEFMYVVMRRQYGEAQWLTEVYLLRSAPGQPLPEGDIRVRADINPVLFRATGRIEVSCAWTADHELTIHAPAGSKEFTSRIPSFIDNLKVIYNLGGPTDGLGHAPIGTPS